MTTHKTIEGNLNAAGLKTAVIASRFNHLFVDKLASGALDALKRHGANESDQTLVWVPGGWEMPLAAQKAAQTPPQGLVDIQATPRRRRGASEAQKYRGAAISGLPQSSLGFQPPRCRAPQPVTAAPGHRNDGQAPSN